MDVNPLAQYQRSIVASMLQFLDTEIAALPDRPASYMWSGDAQRIFSDELEQLRAQLRGLRGLVGSALDVLTMAEGHCVR